MLMQNVLILSILATSALALSNSKISIFTSLAGPNSNQFIEQAQPRLVLLYQNFDNASAIKAKFPDMVIIGRCDNYVEYDVLSVTPEDALSDWWNTTSATILQYPAIDYWEGDLMGLSFVGYNEPDVSTVEKMTWYSQLEELRTVLLAQHGLKSCIGQFMVSTPDVTNPSIIEAFYPAIDAALKYDGILGLHEYAGPFLNSSYTGSIQNGSGWLTGRYRKLYQQYLIPTNRTIRAAITECGADATTCQWPQYTKCDVNLGAWMSLCYPAWKTYMVHGSCDLEYFNELVWYDSVLRSDDYMIGMTIFVMDLVDMWWEYDVGVLNPYFIPYMQTTN